MHAAKGVFCVVLLVLHPVPALMLLLVLPLLLLLGVCHGQHLARGDDERVTTAERDGVAAAGGDWRWLLCN